ncbi:hypothetical protein N0V82_002747 [Gnomoniopsis sp. IMI 355080]|nr:hypothetical protein N0V82_002747 [Gnomoniopsis sp. IMI 355080]
MKYLQLLLAATTALAAPTTTLAERASPVDSALQKRATKFCDAFGSVSASPYVFYHNNWGASAATSGSQCTTFNDLSNGSTASWSTSWTWAGGPYNVKSYSNVALEGINKQLSAVKSIESTWAWSQTGSDIITDVSYDLWLSPTSGGTDAYEIMVWLGAYGGAGPISSSGSAIATIDIAGHSWKLYSGPNGDTTVYSFVASSNVTNFSGDLNLFFKYLVSEQGVSNDMYITHLQAGTEPFTGTDAVFTTSAYKIAVA